MNKTQKELEEKGYIVNLEKRTSLQEPFVSKIDGEVFLREIAYSSKANDFDFLEKCKKDLKGFNIINLIK